MATPFLAQISMFAGNFSPRDWAFCNGSLFSIAQNTALFSLLGTTFGGNGQTTFALPDLRGRVPVGTFQGPGLPNVVLGESSGSNTTTLNSANLPAHNHPASATLRATTAEATDTNPSNRFLAFGNQYADSGNVNMNAGAVPVTVGVTGSSTPFSNMQPYLGINFIIAIQGVYPARN